MISLDLGLGFAIGPITHPLGGPRLSIGDLAVQPGTDVLFGIRSNADGEGLGGLLYTIDPDTAVATEIGDTGTCGGGGLAFDPDGTLYFTGFAGCQSGHALHILDPATAAILSSFPVSNFYEGLGARPTDGALFASVGALPRAASTTSTSSTPRPASRSSSARPQRAR